MSNEWQPMSTAPRNATEIEVSTDLRSVVAHWAEGDGENVPPFRGWFEAGDMLTSAGAYSAPQPAPPQ